MRANQHVTLILVDGFTGDQFLLDIGLVRSVDAGPLFEGIALQLKASSAQVGMSKNHTTAKSQDLSRAGDRKGSVSGRETVQASMARAAISLPALSEAVRTIKRQAEVDEIIDSLLTGVRQVLGFKHVLVLIRDGYRDSLVATGSIGYERSELGSEVTGNNSMIGAAATSGQAIKVNGMSRERRFGEARSRLEYENFASHEGASGLTPMVGYCLRKPDMSPICRTLPFREFPGGQKKRRSAQSTFPVFTR